MSVDQRLPIMHGETVVWLVTTLVMLCCVSMPVSALSKPVGCGKDFGCYSYCVADTCDFVVTWQNLETQVQFELKLELDGSEDQWIAVGLSSDQKMGSDSVTDCIMQGLTVSVGKSTNTEDKSNTVLTAAAEGLQNTNGLVGDGVLTCVYRQTKASNNSEIASLTEDWYLLVAYGKATNGFKLQHGVEPLPSVSQRKVNLQKHEDVEGRATYVLVKVHGSLMIFTWIFCISIGLVLPRYYRLMWPNSTLCKEQIWFAFHRPLMVLALLSSCAAFIIIFIEVGGWSTLDGSTTWQKWHPILGCIVTAFIVLNPLMALVRPEPDAKNRKYFNWAHFVVGTLAQILSVLVLVLGVTLSKASVPFYCVWILVAWAFYQTVMELIMLLLDCFKTKGDPYRDNGKLPSPRFNTVRKLLLGLHVLIITGFTVACIVIVVM